MLLRLVMPIASLLLGTSLLLFGTGLLNTLLPVRGSAAGFSEQALGVVTSCYFIGFLIGTRYGPRLIRRIGHIRAFAFCAAIVASAVLCHALSLNVYGWMLLRIVTGTALVTLYTLIESWLNGQSAREQRGQVYAAYMVVNLGSLALSQQLLRFDGDGTFVLYALSAIFITTALMPVTLTRMTPPPVSDAPPVKLAQLYHAAPVAGLGALLSGLAMGAFWGLTPLFVDLLGLGQAAIANVMSAAIVGGALLQWPIGHYSDRHDRRRVLLLSALAAAGCALLLALSGVGGAGVALLMMAAALYGGFAFAIYPIAVAHLIDNLAPEQVLEGSSGLLLVHGVGAAIGPAVAGLLMQWGGATALPLYFLAMQGALVVLVLRQLQAAPAVISGDAQPAHYVPMVRTTPEVLQLHPDTELEVAE